MAKINVRLLKPLNGREIGSEAEYDQKDIKRLVALGAVEVIGGKQAAKPKAAKKKAAPNPLNKMEPAPMNKAAGSENSPPAGGESSAEDETKG